MSVGILIVDPQYDFFPGGALGVKGGDEIVEPINTLIHRHPEAPLFVSRDWHPPHSRHFRERGGIWPPHCIQGTRGAAFHTALDLKRARVFSKGMDPEDDAGYSAFEGVRDDEGRALSLADELARRGIDSIVIAGLTTDYCVRETVHDAIAAGILPVVYRPGVRAVDLEPGDGERALAEMKAAGALIVDRPDQVERFTASSAGL